MRDTLDAIAEVESDSGLKFYIAVLAKQLVELGDIPKEQITAALLAELFDVDLAAIQVVQERTGVGPGGTQLDLAQARGIDGDHAGVPQRGQGQQARSPHRHLECGLQFGLETDQKAATGGRGTDGQS